MGRQQQQKKETLELRLGWGARCSVHSVVSARSGFVVVTTQESQCLGKQIFLIHITNALGRGDSPRIFRILILPLSSGTSSLPEFLPSP
jgi:hypothetical protein